MPPSDRPRLRPSLRRGFEIRALLLDRDGVLIPERPYVYKPEDLVLLPNVLEGLHRLKDAYHFFVVSNQSGVARGFDTLEGVRACHEVLRSLLRTGGVELDDIVFCPHHPDDGCLCRKPRTGMWETLAQRHGLAPQQSVMVGNRGSDIAFGRAIGCTSVLVEDPAYAEEQATIHSDLRVRDLAELASLLLHS